MAGLARQKPMPVGLTTDWKQQTHLLQGRMPSKSPAWILLGNSGSTIRGRFMTTKSALPSATAELTVAGARRGSTSPTNPTGMETAALTMAHRSAKAATPSWAPSIIPAMWVA